MELSELRKLVRLMQSAELSELEIEDSKEGLRVHLKRGPEEQPERGIGPQVLQVLPSGAPAAQPAVPGPEAPGSPAAPEGLPAGVEAFESPLVGTFYRAPAPDADPFVEVGARVGEDTVLCIIEAMKVMNEIKAEMKGELVEVLVENGEPVEFGQPLFLLKKG